MRQKLVAAVLSAFALTCTMVEPMMQAEGRTSSVDSLIAVTLNDLRDRNRPLLVFAPTDNDERFLRQTRLFAAGSYDMRERQVLFVPLVVRKQARSSGFVRNSLDTARLTPRDSAAVRERFRIRERDFTVILIGKDGGEKFRSHTPVTIDRLNLLIDAMPMRQQEVQNGHSK